MNHPASHAASTQPNGDFVPPDDHVVEKLLREARVIAVIGLSDNPERASHGVSRYLQGQGYRIIPVNPTVDEVLGETAVDSLADIQDAIDIVDVFRAPEHVPDIVQSVIDLDLPALWLQEGVVAPQAAARAQKAGVTVVMDQCMLKLHRRLL